MILHFPHETAFLPRTKLSYINLAGLLNDGKRDRTARVSGFVAINLGEVSYLIFLRDGEPFHAARITAAAREPIAIAEVLRIVAEEIDHGETGSIAYYGAPEAQLRAMLATVVASPLALGYKLGSGTPERLFPTLRERAFTGVVELSGGREVNYLCFEEGNYSTGFLCGREAGMPVGEFVRSIFRSTGSDLRVGLFDALAKLPRQAPPGLVDLYRRLVQGVTARLAEQFGARAAATSVGGVRSRISQRHPFVTVFELAGDGAGFTLRGDPMVSPEELTDGMAAWLTEILLVGGDGARMDPAEVIELATRDDRFALADQGFFTRLPWPVAS